MGNNNNSWKCDVCGNVNSNYQTACECGNKKTASQIMTSDENEAFSIKKWTCSNCGKLVNHNLTTCTCGAKKTLSQNYVPKAAEENAYDESNAWKCGKCGKLVSNHQTACECGAKREQVQGNAAFLANNKSNNEPQGGKKSKIPIIIGGALFGAAAIFAIAIGVYFTMFFRAPAVASEEKSTQSTTTSTSSRVDYTSDKKDSVKRWVNNYAEREFRNTKIRSIVVNDDLGTSAPNDYVVLVTLTWNVKNSASTSKKMLELYSSEIASAAYKQQPNIQEIVLFWDVPYLKNASAKISYERSSAGMKITDKYFDGNFR